MINTGNKQLKATTDTDNNYTKNNGQHWQQTEINNQHWQQTKTNNQHWQPY